MVISFSITNIEKNYIMKFIAFLVSIFIFQNMSICKADDKLVIEHLTGDFYIYTTYNYYEENRIPANGMYIVTNEGVILIDSPWDSTQCQPLLDSIAAKHNTEVTMCIATHWHSDKTDGLNYFRRKGIQTFASKKTDELCIKNEKNRSEYTFTNDTVFHLGQYSFTTYYPGQGHTEDNIVIWFDNEKILYGGCLIKGSKAKNLGYTGDGNTTTYASTLKTLQEKFPKPKFIVVSHSPWEDNLKALKHSIRLAKKLK